MPLSLSSFGAYNSLITEYYEKITYLLLFTFWGTLLYSQNIVVDGVTFHQIEVY